MSTTPAPTLSLENINDSISISISVSEHIFTKSIEIIDKKFGRGYAMKNPSVLTSLIHSHEFILQTTLK
jgi:hypothetical protein